eukprot:scaffold565025_cov45-Prasinocladus_malaysianus.AAC.1
MSNLLTASDRLLNLYGSAETWYSYEYEYEHELGTSTSTTNVLRALRILVLVRTSDLQCHQILAVNGRKIKDSWGTTHQKPTNLSWHQ